MKKLILIITILLALALPIKVEAKTNFVNSNNVLEVQVKFDDSGMYNDEDELLYLDCGNAKKIPAILPNISSVIFKMLQIILPLVLIVMGSVDLLKGVIGKKDDEIEKGKQTFIKRIILGGTFFFVVTLVRFIATLTVDTGEENTIGACIDCFINGSCDAAYPKAFVNDGEGIQRKEEGSKLRQDNVDSSCNPTELWEKYASKISNRVSTATECATCNENLSDGSIVKVVNGVFYYLNIKACNGTSAAKGSGTKGLNAVFSARLDKFFKAAKSAGYTIWVRNQGFRTLNDQKYFYCCYTGQYLNTVSDSGSKCSAKGCNNGNTAAEPGTSNHGWGLAADLGFCNNNQDGSSNTSCTKSSEAVTWAHDHAKEYGLEFNVSNEDWHIVPLDRVKIN